MPPTDLLSNPAAVALVNAEVERAVAPYVGLLAPERIEAMRCAVRDALFVHPALARFTALAVPAPVVQESGALESDDADAVDDERRRGGDGG